MTALLLTVGVFTFDMFTPFDMMVSVLSVVPVVVAFGSLRASHVICVAACGSLLSRLVLLILPLGSEPWTTVVNHTLTIVAIWTGVELKGQLALVSRILPMSPMVLEVFALASSNTSTP